MHSFRFVALVLISFFFLQEGRGEDFITFPEGPEFLPKSWIADPIAASIEPLKVELRERAAKILEEAIQKYPVKLKEKYINGVAVVGSLRFYNVGYGGTYMANSRRIVLVYRETFEDRGFEQRFHHEFSSLLLKQNESLFEAKRWSSANEPGFSYRAGGVVEEQNGDRSEATKVLAAEQKKTGGSGSTLLQLDPNLMKGGFLTAYNQVSVEQDLNETAAHLFTNPELWHFCEVYPRVDQKVDVLIDFYRELDESMDRLYFRNLTETATATPEP
jgi:hypothetical protein